MRGEWLNKSQHCTCWWLSTVKCWGSFNEICPWVLVVQSRCNYFKIWPWKSLVKAMRVVKGQGHIRTWQFKGQGQTHWSHLMPRVQSICLRFLCDRRRQRRRTNRYKDIKSPPVYRWLNNYIRWRSGHHEIHNHNHDNGGFRWSSIGSPSLVPWSQRGC